MVPAEIRELVARVEPFLPEGRVGVAYSGGVDSAALLAICENVLGHDRTLGITAVSASFAVRERVLARRTARQIGAKVVEIATRETEDEDYIRNDVDRCYFCKKQMFTVIDDAIVKQYGLSAVAYGENADDAQRIDRPGAKAATEHGVLRPLAQAGLTKEDVRRIARGFGLDVADKPASPCLASRIPHGFPVNQEKLRQIEGLEETLYEIGVDDCRVRHHETIARIEVSPADAQLVLQHAADVVDRARELGFGYATVDLNGIQSGANTLVTLQLRMRGDNVGDA